MQSQAEPLYHLPEMVRYIKVFVAIFCIVCILALCIAPYADIPVSVLDALQFVIMLMFAMVSGVLLLVWAFYRFLAAQAFLRPAPDAPKRSLLLPIETTCVQQV